ncbi:MAG: Ig-like domain-containing protein, partial [Aquincola sp.]|nr:Ig-like domain-containing protein [Aquincola sp.]
MPTFVNTPRGTVVSIWGKAYIRGTDGAWRPLKLGEVVMPGDALLTEQNAIVQMTDGPREPIKLGELGAIDRSVDALDRGDLDAAPAAGLAGGDSGDLQPGLRIDRIVESITPADLATQVDAAPLASSIAAQSNPPEATDASRLVAPTSSIGAIESGAPVGLGLGTPTGSGSLVVTVTQLPVIGQVVLPDGTPVTVGTTLAPTDLPGLRYLPPADYDGVAPVGGFGYTVDNGVTRAGGGTQISLTAVNDAPLATPGAATGDEDSTIGVSLVGTDIDGTVTNVTVTTLPGNGTLLLADGVTAVTANQSLAPAQAANLIFRPTTDFNGNASVGFTVTDNGGAVSAPASFAITVSPVNDAPVARGDAVSTVAQAPVSVAVLANDSDVDGDPISLAGASVDAAQGSVVVNSDGTLTFIAAPGVSGPVAVSYTVADPSGATASATLTVNVAAAPAVTVDGPALTNDSTPTITGTSNLPPGSTVTLTVTGADNAVQTFTAIVQPNGSYSADVPAPLAEGPYSISASVTIAGQSANANDGGSIDTTAPTITVDAPALGNDSTPTITGSTDLPPGSSVTLIVTGANGAVQTFTATVQPGGSYSADVPAALAEGSYTVVAIGIDAAGNSGSASDAGTVDTTPPTITVDAPALTNDTTPTITGTSNLPVGAPITLTVTGADGAVQTFTATVQPGGTYSADVPSPLAQGTYSVVASAADAAGNAASASDTGVLDTTAPTLTVDAPALTNDSTPTITGTTDLPAGATVTLTVTGANGAVQTFTTTVQPGGTYSGNVPSPLAEGPYVVVASAADAAGNAATANDSGAVDFTPPALTVDAPAVTNDSTPAITGTTDLPTGATVTLTVTGANGTVQTFTTTVLPGGTYSADVPAALVEGSF